MKTFPGVAWYQRHRQVRIFRRDLAELDERFRKHADLIRLGRVSIAALEFALTSAEAELARGNGDPDQMARWREQLANGRVEFETLLNETAQLQSLRRTLTARR
jgi:hypothetical protein